MALPPPPINARERSRMWKDWFMRVQTDVVSPTGVSWSGINFTGSKLTDILTRPHSALQSISGSSDGYHVSSAVATSTTTGLWATPLKSNVQGGVGYATGAGGTVVQATSKSTSVTLNKICGTVTMNGAALAAATIVSFTMNNSSVAAGDVVVVNHTATGTLGAYTVNAVAGSGTIQFNVRNATAGSLSQAIVLTFAVIKAVTS